MVSQELEPAPDPPIEQRRIVRTPQTPPLMQKERDISELQGRERGLRTEANAKWDGILRQLGTPRPQKVPAPFGMREATGSMPPATSGADGKSMSTSSTSSDCGAGAPETTGSTSSSLSSPAPRPGAGTISRGATPRGTALKRLGKANIVRVQCLCKRSEGKREAGRRKGLPLGRWVGGASACPSSL